MTVNWNLYRFFYYVATTRTTTGAAQALYVAQPAVSHAIKQLEDALGCQLFTRSSKGMELTDYGHILFDAIAPAVKNFEQASARIERTLKNNSSTVNLGCSEVVYQFFWFVLSEQFETEFPNIQISRTATFMKQIEDDLKSGRIDVALIHDCTQLDGFECIPVYKTRDIMACGANFRDKISESCLTPQSAMKYPLLGHEPGCTARKYADKYFSDSGLVNPPTAETELVSSLLRMLTRRFYIAFVLYDQAAEVLRSGGIVEIPMSPPPQERYFYLIGPKHTNSSAVKTFCKFVTEHANI